MPKIGLQLYTLRDLAKEDFVGTLKKVAAVGFEGVEFAGYGGLKPAELAQVCKDLGLTPASSHVGYALLENQLSEVIEDAQQLGLEYIVCPSLPEDKRDVSKLSDFFNAVGEQIHAAGMKFAYHNHAFEFARVDGKYALDSMYESTNPNYVQAELDVYWVEFAGESPAKYVTTYQNRCELLHIKDMTKDDERFFAEVGTGRIDFQPIFKAAEAGNVKWYFVEQDVCRKDPLECVTTSYQFLKQFAE